ncbi:MAG: acetylglutamate kinase [Xanthomonadales bacterium]|nr:acetylglutamate kinase [Gammaproteobacteria bacterium]MBT8052259.1 acetylglutamate kinase [Gammaproteobacteria bacterium]NND57387.1 acetylglutamate kinase [Xanthomonadales bacterium]NNK52583.1 acetylglutamate kinase [Xanthomonadales bacterium]
MAEIRSVVSQVLSQLGTSREARYYLKQYSHDADMQFAVIKVGGAVLEEELDPLASALAFLRNLGLMPIILHGAGPQLDVALQEASIETVKRRGLRVTTPEVMEIARPVIYRANRRLVSALDALGVRAQGVQHGVFVCDYLDREEFGLVGHISNVDLEAIRDAVERGVLPVVACLGESPTGQVMNINADIAARELIWEVKPHKIIFLTGTGGLLDESGRIISAISLRTDYEYLVAQNWVHSGMQLKLEQISQLLSGLPETASVSITSVDSLARELFTHRGAGTLIRVGEEIIESHSFSPELREKAAGLLEQSFGRRLKPGYFDDLPLECILSSETTGAMAIVLKGVDGIPYLDKFAVTPEAQGAGLGAAVWQALIHRCPQLYWRSRTDNPVTPWYFDQADASLTQDKWVAFSVGIDNFDQLRRCRDDCLARGESWEENEHV